MSYTKSLDEAMNAISFLEDYMAMKEIKHPELQECLSQTFTVLKTELYTHVRFIGPIDRTMSIEELEKKFTIELNDLIHKYASKSSCAPPYFSIINLVNILYKTYLYNKKMIEVTIRDLTSNLDNTKKENVI